MACSSKQSRITSPVLSGCFGRNLESTAGQDFEWHMNVTGVEWLCSLLRARKKGKRKGVPLGRVKFPEEARWIVVFIMKRDTIAKRE